jgi:excisionase family DNA binding protein
MPKDILLSTKEASEYLGVSTHTLNMWRAKDDGRYPIYFRFGRKIMYRQSELDAWIESCRVKPGCKESTPDVQ